MEEALNNISIATILFMIYSFLGWLMEVALVSIENKKASSRGFLIGPICPIYGYGCLILIYFLQKYADDIPALFIMGSVSCSILEYFTSYAMEKLFKARWWDYSTEKFNLNGRICLKNTICFGILGCVLLRVINPLVAGFVCSFSSKILYIWATVLMLFYIIDIIITFNVVSKVKTFGFKAREDNTVEITKKIKEELAKSSVLYRRLLSAFPNFTSTIKSKKEELTERAKEIRGRLEKYIEEQREELSQRTHILKKKINIKRLKLDNRKIRFRIKRKGM